MTNNIIEQISSSTNNTDTLFLEHILIITIIIDRSLLNRGTGIGIATDLNTVVQLWEHFGKPHVPVCRGEFIPTAQRTHTDSVNMTAHHCLCVTMGTKTQTSRHVWQQQGEESEKRKTPASQIFSAFFFFSHQLLGIPLAFTEEVTSFPVSDKQKKWSCHFVCVDECKRCNVRSFSTLLFHFDLIVSSSFFFLLLLTHTYYDSVLYQ